MLRHLTLTIPFALLAACGATPADVDAGEDSGTAAADSGLVDAGPIDAGTTPDAGTARDAGGEPDAGAPDAGQTLDAGQPDAGQPDAGHTVDAGLPSDAGSSVDAGPADAGRTVRFIAVGDTGKGNTGQFAVGQAMGTVCAAQGCDFVVLLGDNFYPSGVTSTSDPQWNSAFVQPYASVDAGFYAVMGNHDYGGNGAGTEPGLAQHQIDYGQVNPKWRMPFSHYRWSIGEVDFIAADTNRSFKPISLFDDAMVRADVSTWLTQSQATWKFVFGHHPYLSNGEHGNAGNYDPVCVGTLCLPLPAPLNGVGVKSFLDDVVCNRADFYISGHDHNLQWPVGTCGTTKLMVSGGGSALTTFVGSQPTHFQTDTKLGFFYLVITGRTLTVSAYDSTGVVLFTRTVTK